MRFDAMKDAKPFRTAFAVLAVAAVVMVMLGAGILSRPKPSVLVAHSIEMAIPELQSVTAEPARVLPVVVVPAKEKDAEDKSAEPKAVKNSTSARTAPAPLTPKPKAVKDSNSKDLAPKRSLKNGLFDYGEKAGANPEQ